VVGSWLITWNIVTKVIHVPEFLGWCLWPNYTSLDKDSSEYRDVRWLVADLIIVRLKISYSADSIQESLKTSRLQTHDLALLGLLLRH